MWMLLQKRATVCKKRILDNLSLLQIEMRFRLLRLIMRVQVWSGAAKSSTLQQYAGRARSVLQRTPHLTHTRRNLIMPWIVLVSSLPFHLVARLDLKSNSFLCASFALSPDFFMQSVVFKGKRCYSLLEHSLHGSRLASRATLPRRESNDCITPYNIQVDSL